MERLLYAAARGATLQYYNPQYEWVTTDRRPAKDESVSWRIAPRHSYLQYGPISKALIELAVLQPAKIEWVFTPPYLLSYLEGEVEEAVSVALATPNTRVIFLLLVAEFYADMGL